jgi:hypothetical protein
MNVNVNVNPNVSVSVKRFTAGIRSSFDLITSNFRKIRDIQIVDLFHFSSRNSLKTAQILTDRVWQSFLNFILIQPCEDL